MAAPIFGGFSVLYIHCAYRRYHRNSQQINFLQQVRLGYDKENVLILPLDAKTEKVYATFSQSVDAVRP